MKKIKQSTAALHAGHIKSKTEQTMAVPIYQNVAYSFDDMEHAIKVFSLQEPGYIYTRLNNPTNDILEKRFAAIEGGIGAVSFASGTSAVSTCLLTLLKSGDHIVASSSLYGGTFNMLNATLPRFGITTTFVDADNPDNFRKAIKENTRVIFAEALGNPRLDIIDIEEVANIAKTADIPFIVDNTVLTPTLLKPFDYGVDMVIHSLTKYIGGQGNSMGGVLIDSGNFDWTSKNFPELNTPTKSYHGLIYTEAAGQSAFLMKLRVEGLRDFGGAISPYNAFAILQGLETLDVRMKRHSQNALEMAKWLEQQDEISWVNYPLLESSKYKKLADKYINDGASGVLTFGIKKGFEAAKKFIQSTDIISMVANFGDTKSMFVHPASTTHQQLTEEEQKLSGVSLDLIRFSVGLEDVEDLKQDIKNAFRVIDN